MDCIKIFLVAFVIVCFFSCKGQVDKVIKSPTIITSKKGQAVSNLDKEIWEIFQDSKANYWFGSNGRGVYFFDGRNLKKFTTEDGLVHNQLRGIQEDRKGNIYFETSDGISKFDGSNFTTLKTTQSIENQWKLQEDDLWFGYDAKDLYRYDGSALFELELPRQDLKEAFGSELNAGTFGTHDKGPYLVYGVDKDKEGNLWIGTERAGAFRYNGHSFLWFGEKELSTLPDGRVPAVRSMLQDRDGYFWLSNFHSKYKINPFLPKGYEKVRAVNIPTSISKDKILYFNSGLVDNAGDLWMTTYRGGVWKYDGKTLSNIEIHNGQETVLLICIYEDANGLIWLGTHNDGVYIQNGDVFEKFEPKTN